MTSPTHPGGLAYALLRASDWFNDALLVRLETAGWPRLNRTQSLTFASLGPDGTRPADLARSVGISRQSMQTLLADLADHGLVEVTDDPADRRAKIVRVSDRGRHLASDASGILADLEGELAGRIGAPAVAALREVLDHEWGAASG